VGMQGGTNPLAKAFGRGTRQSTAFPDLAETAVVTYKFAYHGPRFALSERRHVPNLGVEADAGGCFKCGIVRSGRARPCLNALTFAKRGELVALACKLVHVLQPPVREAIAFLDERPKLPLGARGIVGARLGFGLGRLGFGLGRRNRRGHFFNPRSELRQRLFLPRDAVDVDLRKFFATTAALPAANRGCQNCRSCS